METDTKVRLMVIFLPKPEHRDKLRRSLVELAAQSRREEGCQEYRLHEDIDHPGTFVLYEIWGTQGDLDRHLALPALQSFVAELANILSEPLMVRRLKALTD